MSKDPTPRRTLGQPGPEITRNIGRIGFCGSQDTLLGDNNPRAHIMKANFIWDLPHLTSAAPALRAVGLVINDWQLAGIWTGATAAAYTVGYSYQNGGSNVNLTGSPDYAGRIRVVGDPGSGCSSNVYQQFNTAAFQGPLVGTVGLDSANGYLKSCFSSALDLSIQRTIRVGGGRSAARGSVQRAERGADHQSQDDSEPAQPDRSCDRAEPAVRRERQPDCDPIVASERGIRRRERLPIAALGPGADPLQVLNSPGRLGVQPDRLSCALTDQAEVIRGSMYAHTTSVAALNKTTLEEMTMKVAVTSRICRVALDAQESPSGRRHSRA
jgi:hypothetical protein